MNNPTSPELSTTQKELEELRARLRQNSEVMQNSAKKSDANALMSGAIQVVGTFEKRNN